MNPAQAHKPIGKLSLACLLLAAHSQWSWADGAPTALRAELLGSAQRWSDKNRTDIARQKLDKLLAMEPDSPEGLAFLGDLALRENKLDEARKILATLQTRQPLHPATRELEQLVQIYTLQREKLARMRLMARAGRTADAAVLALELFPAGPPRYGALGQEIARITGRGAKGSPQVAQTPALTRPLLDTRSTATKAAAKTAPTSSSASARAPITPAALALALRPEVVTAQQAESALQPAPLAPAAPEVPATPEAAPASASALAAARADSLRAQADGELKAERLSPALRLLEQALQETPDDAWLRYDLARLYARLQLPEQARSVSDEGVARAPADTDMRYAHALLLASLDDDAAALADLQRIPVAERSAGMQALEQRLNVALRAQASNTLLQSARQKRSEGRYGEALGLFQQARQNALASVQAGSPSTADAQDALERDIRAIEARRQAWVEVGQETLEKNSTEGLGSLRGWERPVVAWLPWGYDGNLFIHADQVQLDAGSYAGGDAFAQPGTELITRGLAQRADGVNVGLGYVGEDLRWDLGETGVGFAVRNWVGGLRYGGDIGNVAYSAELSRRPLTGTLLSYAGTQDPQTGAVWGGVVATGVGGRVSTELGPFSTSASASLAMLTGLNVADNSRLKWRLAADRDVWRSAEQTVNIGVALSGLQHDKDLSGYTWGHGGYYSPQRNVTLAFPVEWSGHTGPLRWLVKASVSASSSSSNATDYYPGDAAMQQRAGNPRYDASSSTGTGWSVSGAAEYQVTPHLAIGGRLEHEVSDYYTPLNLLFYARYAFDPVRQTTVQRPRPVQAYSQF
ncbi:hypothetical protein DIC66_05990 [Rhodoferax lacus]|uniref:Cellulose synthase operon C C-terminal domain-containing protein n=1 Tax=Rhodoferax lacus TaxID=2184758 RepID=A0A3E1RFV3_9BURK|nr:cellulose synthase subunit BcsC-related outer membrane protein [Rhodoferax lacus]RFO98257.1 hypothetical protein DIC66_05990 [Rhodoferax lacus]